MLRVESGVNVKIKSVNVLTPHYKKGVIFMDKTLSKRKRISEVVKKELAEATERENKVSAVGRAEMVHVSKQVRTESDKKRANSKDPPRP